ncbi:MAG TPA: hypothetical protein VME86_13800 [Acidobacteriaceae bacterium]|nr:hypothetical protein [Acidobacteriaceae bacterium]
MRLALSVTLLLVAGASARTAPVQTAPVLHARTAEPAPAPQTQATPGYSTLPANASGEFQLDDNGSVVQITIQNNRLVGYVTRIEGSAALTLFFDKTSLEGSRITFTTYPVHDLHYGFKGEIVRGHAASPDQTGFYQMVGELTEYRDNLMQRRTVHLKSTPRTL